MTPANEQMMVYTMVIMNIPTLALLIIAVVFFIVQRWCLTWFLMVLGAAIVQFNSWLGFFTAWNRTEMAGRQGVLALERAISENTLYGFYHSLVGLAGWSLIIISLVLLALGRAKRPRQDTRSVRATCGFLSSAI